MLSQWTTTTNWTDLGSPYLWWTGADDGPIAATVRWGLSSGRLGHGKKVGVVVSDQASDQSALNSYLLPDLKKIGVVPEVETITADLGETASTDSDATLAVERLKEAGIQSVIPLLPENAFTPYIGAETMQNFFPKLLISDYQSEIEVALGLIPIPYEKALNGQEGVTAETLGGIDSPIPEAQGGYDPGVRQPPGRVGRKAYPQIPKGNINDHIEEQGPIQGWCQEIRLFAKAATMAGRNLNRRTFVEAMSRITDFPGGNSSRPELRSGQIHGPTEYRVVEVHDNHPPTSQCKRGAPPAPAAGACWVVVRRTGSRCPRRVEAGPPADTVRPRHRRRDSRRSVRPRFSVSVVASPRQVQFLGPAEGRPTVVHAKLHVNVLRVGPQGVQGHHELASDVGAAQI